MARSLRAGEVTLRGRVHGKEFFFEAIQYCTVLQYCSTAVLYPTPTTKVHSLTPGLTPTFKVHSLVSNTAHRMVHEVGKQASHVEHELGARAP